VRTWLGLVIAIISTISALAPASAADKILRVDPWGIELTDFCDLRDGAPISDKCYGFVAATVEATRDRDVTRRPDEKQRLCIPRRTDIAEMIAKIRPRLRMHFGLCAGLCTSEGYVASELYRAYPCPPSKT
jgi:hypothetical protein